ncbi:MAG TPA: ATP-binding protein [Polyangia bacterium]|nr:ATP-binding protein [Polyangia bacterium]
MSLRAKLILAQSPLALALLLLGVVSGSVTRRLGAQARLILADNYRSVLAAERMKGSLDRLNGDALVLLAGHPEGVAGDLTANRGTFERELVAQEGNITEPGEGDATRALRKGWVEYQASLDQYLGASDRDTRDRIYFSQLQPRFRRADQLADEILGINQDAMVHKVDRADRRAEQFERLVILAIVLALGIGVVSSTWLTTRTTRPLGVVAAAVRRFGENDFKARAQVRGKDEIASVATEFNRMADRLERYRQSSLGELLQAEQAAQSAIDSLPDPILLMNAEGGLHGANTAAGRVLGIDPDLEGSEVYARADPGVRAVVEKLRAHVLGGKGNYVPKGFEEALRVANTPEGEKIMLPRATPIYGEGGNVSGATIVLQDATRLFRFDELKNNLVATVAHELRTPLTSLRMALHLCTEGVVGSLTAKQADLMFAARDDCERLQVIVDELLNLSRIESGQIELRRRRASPESLVAPAVDVHKGGAEQAGVTIAAEVPPGLPDVFVDPDRLQLVFTNMLNNAVRFAPRDSQITVRARVTRSSEVQNHKLSEPDEVRFEVVDQGPGIPKEHQVGLFEKFFRVPGSPMGGGSGLGLFIAKGLVQAHGGRIGVDSQPGRGATFWFTVPVAPAVERG